MRSPPPAIASLDWRADGRARTAAIFPPQMCERLLSVIAMRFRRFGAEDQLNVKRSASGTLE